MYQPPWIRFLGFSTPPPSMGLSPLNLRQEMGHLHTFHDVLLAFQKKKNGAALHIRRPGRNNQGDSRAFCVFFLGGEMNELYIQQSFRLKNWGAALCCASFGSPQTKTHVDLINEYQSPKRQNMFQHGSTSCEPKQSLFQGLCLVCLCSNSCCCETYRSATSLQLGKESNLPGHPSRSLLSCWQLTIFLDNFDAYGYWPM